MADYEADCVVIIVGTVKLTDVDTREAARYIARADAHQRLGQVLNRDSVVWEIDDVEVKRLEEVS